MIFKIVLLISIVLAASCSPVAPEKTTAEISLGAYAQLSSKYQGGLYFIGYHVKSKQTTVRLLKESEVTLELLTGDWIMGIYGWQDVTEAFEGEMKCGLAKPTLGSSVATIEFKLTSHACDHEIFTSKQTAFKASDNQVKPLRIQSCGLIDNVIASKPIDYDCSAVDRGNKQSFRVILFDTPLTLTPMKSAMNPQKSRCYDSSGASYVNTDLKLPIGKLPNSASEIDIGLPILIEAFSEAGCTGSKTEYPFPRGLGGGSKFAFVQASNSANFPNNDHITAFLGATSQDGVYEELQATISLVASSPVVFGGSSVDRPQLEISFNHSIDATSFDSADIINVGTSSGVFNWTITNPSLDNKNFLATMTTTPPLTDGTFIPRIVAGVVNDINVPVTQTNLQSTYSGTLISVDSTPPTLTSTAPNISSAPFVTFNRNIVFKIVFNEPINASTLTEADISLTPTQAAETWTISNPSNDNKTFILTATGFDIVTSGAYIDIDLNLAAMSVDDLYGNTGSSYNYIGSPSWHYFSCPNGYIPIPHNSLVGQDVPFCVMQYEARDNGSGIPMPNPSNLPWNQISANNAAAACYSLGSGYDLISNPEWMAIARNIESVGSNYSSGMVGSGMINRGHSDNIPAYICESQMDNISDCATPDGTNPFDQLRTHNLSTGDVVWDLAGNALEWVDWDPLDGVNNFTVGPQNCNLAWSEISTYIGGCLSTNLASPLDPSLNSSSGVGQILGGSAGAARRGGHRQIGIKAGIYSIDMSQSPNYVNNDTGFRCVYRPGQ